MPLDPAMIAAKLGAPSQNVVDAWPLIMAGLDEQGIRTDLVEIAAAATVGTEVPDFLPICELGGPEYLSRYDYNTELGNTEPGDGVLFKGRGFVQLTGRANYIAAGNALGMDLVGNPDAALELAPAARVLAWFFKAHRVAEAADAEQWITVRRRVNGGLNGWDRFSALVQGLSNG